MDSRGGWQRPRSGDECAGLQFLRRGDGGEDGPAQPSRYAAFDGFDAAEADAAGVGLADGEQVASYVIAVAAAVLQQEYVMFG